MCMPTPRSSFGRSVWSFGSSVTPSRTLDAHDRRLSFDRDTERLLPARVLDDVRGHLPVAGPNCPRRGRRCRRPRSRLFGEPKLHPVIPLHEAEEKDGR